MKPIYKKLNHEIILTEIERLRSLGKPLVLDLFCCAGGSSHGYVQAGFTVMGVDLYPQKHYPFSFIQGNALRFVVLYGHLFDIINSSPPCQFACTIFNPIKGRDSKHKNLIPQTRKYLQASGKLYVIENVKGAITHLRNSIKLTGSMFPETETIFRDRFFESNSKLRLPIRKPFYNFTPVAINGSSKQGNALVSEIKEAMKIDWMIKDELRQAIPPAYTKWIGEQLMRKLKACMRRKGL